MLARVGGSPADRAESEAAAVWRAVMAALPCPESGCPTAAEASGQLAGHFTQDHLVSPSVVAWTRSRRLLDLFCGAGGAARGYQRAGFHVTGVDHKPQPRYAGDVFILGDALEYVTAHGHEYDAIHASPPCQAFTQMSARWRGLGGTADSHPDLLTPILTALAHFQTPWVVENVVGARRVMRTWFKLHGGQFGLGVHRPRLFASNVVLLSPLAAPCADPIGVYGPRRRLFTRRDRHGRVSFQRAAHSAQEACAAMGIDADLTWDEVREAIPPAYTNWIGQRLLEAIRCGR